MKKTENYEQLLVRFNKRKEQLTKEQETFRESHEKWVHLDERLSYLLGCIDTIRGDRYLSSETRTEMVEMLLKETPECELNDGSEITG